MLYVVELVAPIAVCYPTPPAVTSVFVTGSSFSPLDGEKILKFWWKNGASTLGPVPQVTEFEQYPVDFIFTTGLTSSDGLWRVWTEVEMPHHVYLSKFPHPTDEERIYPSKVDNGIEEPNINDRNGWPIRSFLSVNAMDMDALRFARQGNLPFRIRPVDAR